MFLRLKPLSEEKFSLLIKPTREGFGLMILCPKLCAKSKPACPPVAITTLSKE